MAERRRQVLTLEQDRSGWGVFLPPLGRAPLEQLLGAIAAAREPWSELELSGVQPLDLEERWQVLGITADPGEREVNLPVCGSWGGGVRRRAGAARAGGGRRWPALLEMGKARLPGSPARR